MSTSARLAFVLSLALTAGANAAAAQEDGGYLSGHDLNQYCTSTYDTDYGFCAGYVTAVADLLLNESIGGYRACNHGPVRSQQLIDIVTTYADHNPDTLEREARMLTAAAIARAFPCQD